MMTPAIGNTHQPLLRSPDAAPTTVDDTSTPTSGARANPTMTLNISRSHARVHGAATASAAPLLRRRWSAMFGVACSRAMRSLTIGRPYRSVLKRIGPQEGEGIELLQQGSIRENLFIPPPLISGVPRVVADAAPFAAFQRERRRRSAVNHRASKRSPTDTTSRVEVERYTKV